MNATIDAIRMESGGPANVDKDQDDPREQFSDAECEVACLCQTLHDLVILAEDESCSASAAVKSLLVAIESCLQRLDRSVESMSSAFYSARA